MWTVIARCALLALALVAGCGDPPARVTLAPISGTCGKPAGATGLTVTAYAAGGEVSRAVGFDESVAIGDFPDDTEQLGVEVIIGGGAAGSIGKTSPLAFADLADGATIPIFMTPPGGFCPTPGGMSEPRVAPLVARAGEGVLIVGGVDGLGVPLTTAEYYDPHAAAFTPIDVPAVLGQSGFVGAALTTLPDGRVVVTGGPQPAITIYDPETRSFGASVLFEPTRAFHTAIAIDDTQVLVAGGCSAVTAGACGGVPRKSSTMFDTKMLGTSAIGTNLRIGRIGATIFDIGIQADGERAFVIAGGLPPPVGDATGADRFAATADDAVEVTGTHAQAAMLDGGAILSAFAVDGAAPEGAASILPPAATVATPIPKAPDLTGVRLVGLEDGRVAGIGGDADGGVKVYEPTTGRWEVVMPPAASPSDLPGIVASPRLLRLPDGSVLVLGGIHATSTAWIYRPSLVGPQAGSITVVPTSPSNSNVLTAPDPASVTRSAGEWLLAGEDLARALVGGPRTATGSVNATVRVRAGGVALVAQQVGPGKLVVAELAPGTPARLVRVEGGTRHTICSGTDVGAFDPMIAVTVRLAVTSSLARLTRDGVEQLACDVDAGEPGAWGVAALGTGARVAVDTVTVAR
jgi:hypothetical protein